MGELKLILFVRNMIMCIQFMRTYRSISGMAQWVTMLAARSDDLNSLARIHTVEEEDQLPQVVL